MRLCPSFFIGIVITLVWSCQARPVPTDHPVNVAPVEVVLAPDLTVSVDPRIELLGAALAPTPWAMDSQSPGFLGGPFTQYLGQLQAWAHPFRDDAAVVGLAALDRDRGFCWDGPAQLVLQARGNLAFQRPEAGWPHDLAARAGSADRLTDEATALGNLAAAGAFDRLFEDHRAFYQDLIARQTKDFPGSRILAWLRTYYGHGENLRFHLILTPALEPAGGYGPTVGDDVYQVVRDAERIPSGYLFELTLHEFGHHFVNPAVADHVPPEAFAALNAQYEKVALRMQDNSYGNFSSYLNELVLRATTIRGRLALGQVTPAGAEQLLDSEDSIGFHLIRGVYAELPDYEAHRDQWPTFADFAPELLKRIARL